MGRSGHRFTTAGSFGLVWGELANFLSALSIFSILVSLILLQARRLLCKLFHECGLMGWKGFQRRRPFSSFIPSTELCIKLPFLLGCSFRWHTFSRRLLIGCLFAHLDSLPFTKIACRAPWPTSHTVLTTCLAEVSKRQAMMVEPRGAVSKVKLGEFSKKLGSQSQPPGACYGLWMAMWPYRTFSHKLASWAPTSAAIGTPSEGRLWEIHAKDQALEIGIASMNTFLMIRCQAILGEKERRLCMVLLGGSFGKVEDLILARATRSSVFESSSWLLHYVFGHA